MITSESKSGTSLIFRHPQLLLVDACFSGGLTRAAYKGQAKLRGLGVPLKFREEYYVNESAGTTYAVRGPRTSYHIPNLYSGQKSHVLLSACGINEQARETSNGGVFTQALLETLRSIPLPQTYSDIHSDMENHEQLKEYAPQKQVQRGHRSFNSLDKDHNASATIAIDCCFSPTMLVD